jgi:hypothetical protein
MKLAKSSAIGILLLLFPIVSQAYIGPGAGLGAIGTAIALVGALILLIVGFVWYPLKRFLRRRNSVSAPDESDSTVNATNEGDNIMNTTKVNATKDGEETGNILSEADKR